MSTNQGIQAFTLTGVPEPGSAAIAAIEREMARDGVEVALYANIDGPDEIDGAQVVELAECRHDAPLSHPALFAEAMVARLAP